MSRENTLFIFEEKTTTKSIILTIHCPDKQTCSQANKRDK